MHLERNPEKLADLHSNVAYLFDFDGTLVDLVPNPNKVMVSSELLTNLKIISQKADCAFAIVTGRALSQLDRFLNGLQLPAVGNHGAEYRPNPENAVEHLASEMPASISEAMHDISDQRGCFFEDKTFSISLHLPFMHANDDIESDLLKALGNHRNNYLIRKVGRTYEILQRGISKGTGIAHLMKHPRFVGRRPIYVGDDVHIDESLNLLLGMGGSFIPVGPQHNTAYDPQGHLLTVQDVEEIISAIAKF
ncbi:MAG: trehalose-phosphatase [Alphaproteobacteria bacterium]